MVHLLPVLRRSDRRRPPLPSVPQAAQARDFKALELKGQGALLNFPEVATGPRAPPGGMGGAQPFQEYRCGSDGLRILAACQLLAMQDLT